MDSQNKMEYNPYDLNSKQNIYQSDIPINNQMNNYNNQMMNQNMNQNMNNIPNIPMNNIPMNNMPMNQNIPMNIPINDYNQITNNYNKNFVNKIKNLDKIENFTKTKVSFYKEFIVYSLTFLIISHVKFTELILNKIPFINNLNSELPIILIKAIILSLILIFIRRNMKIY